MIELDIIESGDGRTDGLPVVADGPRRTTSMRSRRVPLTDPAVQLDTLASVDVGVGPTGTGNFADDVRASGWTALTPSRLEVFQINIGKLCNMTCRHCHVDSGPDRTQENMTRETVDACLDAVAASGAHTVDITGGAPELNPNFEYLVESVAAMGKHVIDRCNLTVLTVPRYAHLPAWLAAHGVEVVCSLPHYRKLGTDAQRGTGTYEKSLAALRLLNEVGYGKGDSGRTLTLVTNPVGAFLAGDQSSLEAEWKRALKANHGVTFDRLLALNNMPMSRYLEWLLEREGVEAYLTRLVDAFNPATIAGLMCRNTLSVDWEGYLYDCDFNQQLEMHLQVDERERLHVSELDIEAWAKHEIATHRHCYGCTAGAGSGCGGALV